MPEINIQTDSISNVSDSIQSNRIQSNSIPIDSAQVDSIPIDSAQIDTALTDSLSTAFYMDLLAIRTHETQATASDFPSIEKSVKPSETNAIFLIVVCCLLIVSFSFARGKQMIGSMLAGISSLKSRQSIFYEKTGNDFFNKLALLIQFVVISSVFLFVSFSHESDITEVPIINTLTCIGCFCALLIFYLLYKRIGYDIMANIFFNKSRGEFWIEHWDSLIALSGLLMLLPTVLLYFTPDLYYFSFYIVAIWLLTTRIIIIYKSYTIFFSKITRLHYLFLYLCAQEIIPLFFLYKGLVYTFGIVVEKGILWI